MSLSAVWQVLQSALVVGRSDFGGLATNFVVERLPSLEQSASALALADTNGGVVRSGAG
jgi:hypothetical protein